MAGGYSIILPTLILCLFVCLRPSLSAVLYDFGSEAGDIKVTKGRDVAQQLEFSVNFLRMKFETVYVSTKGAILFDTPADPQSRMIAPFYADIDNSKKGTIWYRTSSLADDISRAAQEISTYFPSQKEFRPTHILVVTWENVSFQRNRGLTKGITFQAVIITDDHYTFTEYLYADNNFPRAGAIPVSPVIGFSYTDAEFFDYAIAEDTKTVFERTKSSNVNVKGVWAFQIDGIDPFDIVWGIPEGGNIQGDEALFNDADTDLNINLGLVGDDCSSCADTGSSCVNYGAGSCCVCNHNYMGNGKTCLKNETNKHYRANGVLRGTVNGQDISSVNVHAFIIASEGRTFTAISPSPEGINYTLQFLLPIGETIGWLFAVPQNKGINGFTLTGGSFTSSATLRFNTGEELTIVQEYTTSGENIRTNINIDGTLPVIRENFRRGMEHLATFTRHRPGIVHSFETRTLSTESNDYTFSLEQTINYDDCLADEVDFDPILNSMSLQFYSVNAFLEAGSPILRFSMRSNINPTSELIRDPCENNNCDIFAVCLPDADIYRCECFEGYIGDGLTCEEEVIDPCESNSCSSNADCIPNGESYVCICRLGYQGDGHSCKEEVVDPCESNRCSRNADCIPDGESYVCRCRSGFNGDGFNCQATRGPCDFNRCHTNAVCIPEGSTYYCQCAIGFQGDGFDCVEVPDDPCLGNRCDLNAHCLRDGNAYRCECANGFEGNGYICEEVFMDPCLENDCNPFARCIPNESVYDCQCKPGYEGDGYICVAYLCRENNCDVNADCLASEDGQSYTCQCRPGLRGDGFTCESEVVDVCEGNECDDNGECVPFGDSYDCQCLDGFLGNGYFCIAEDPCFENLCGANADCSPIGDGYQCLCQSGYQGDGFSCRVLDCNSCDANAVCVPEGGGYRCQCNSGFEGNGHVCEDVNECYTSPDPCDSNAYCDNTFGNFVCTCREGFTGDGTYCEVVVRPSGEGMLLYGQGMSVMKMPLDASKEGSRVIHKTRQTIVGLAYDCVDDVIFFTDVAKKSIGRVKIDGTEYKRFVKRGLSSPEGVAVDYISRNLYWTDSGFDRIEVASLDGQNRRILIKADLVNPRAIVADPVSGYLYWTDWNREDPKIERSFMDGSGRETMVKDGLVLPNGLTIDKVSQKICWADAGSEKVECIGVNGDPLTRTTVFSEADYPFGLAAFDQNLYWTDWTSNAVYAVNKNGALTANELVLPQGGSGRLYGIIAAQQCSPGTNACTVDNGGCSALCLPLPRGDKSCACNTDTRGNEIECN